MSLSVVRVKTLQRIDFFNDILARFPLCTFVKSPDFYSKMMRRGEK